MPRGRAAGQDRAMSDDRSGYGPTPPPTGQPGQAGPTPVPPPGPHSGRGATDGFFGAIRRWGVSRSTDRWVGGVAGGLARRFDLDPLLVRGIVGVTMLMGFGFVLYGVAWALLPEESDGRIHLEEAIRGSFDVALLGAILSVVIGAQAGDWWFSWGPFDGGWFPALAWVAAAVAVVVILVNARSNRPDGPRPPATPYAPPAPTPDPRTEGSTAMPATGPTPPAATQPVGAPVPPRPLHHGARPGPVPTAGAPVPPPPGRGWTPPPPTPPQPPKPPKPLVRGPGAAVTGVVVALVLIALAGLLLADRAGLYDGPIAAVVLGGGVVLVGLAIVVSGLRGRHAGGLTALAIIGTLAALPAAATAHGSWWDNGDRQAFSDETRVVTDRADAAAGFSFGIGDATIDLSQVPLTGGTLEVPISGGMGDITVVVPSGAAVLAEVTAGAGDITWDVDGREERSGGVGHDRTFRSDALVDGQDAQIALQIDLGMGSITIEED
jgi:phage shock protein PspC (stress-responsive transcriptional regulator)